ncbi:MAG TPA: pyrimidine reductase family protein [Galbitalea sp.]|nr:pyrimidine reductase family protein [Galbitalea sp.]
MVDIASLVPVVSAPLDDGAIADHYDRGVELPWLRVNFVSSLDGAVTVDGKSGGLGNAADHRVFDILRRLCDVVLVAAGTVKAEGYGAMILDDASVAARLRRGLEPQPTFAIVSGSLDLDPDSAVFMKAPVRPLVFTVESAPAHAPLSTVADVIPCGAEELDPAAMIAALVERNLGRVHCEGGPSLFGTLLQAGLVDELCLTLSPLLAGGSAGRIDHADLPDPRRMTLAGALRSEDTLLLRYIRT